MPVYCLRLALNMELTYLEFLFHCLGGGQLTCFTLLVTLKEISLPEIHCSKNLKDHFFNQSTASSQVAEGVASQVHLLWC